MPVTEKDINVLSSRLDTVEDRQAEMREAVAEHRIRLQNGVKVFSDQKERLETIEQDIRPKPPSILTIVGVTLAIVSAGAGALWALANNLRDRPTAEQIDKIIHKHDTAGHLDMKDDIEGVKSVQVEQKILLENMGTEQKTQGRKIDKLLMRVPDPEEADSRPRRSNRSRRNRSP